MIIIEIKSNESIDRCLKRLKRKYERTGLLREIKRRSFFLKPSVRQRDIRLKAQYRQRWKDRQDS